MAEALAKCVAKFKGRDSLQARTARYLDMSFRGLSMTHLYDKDWKK